MELVLTSRPPNLDRRLYNTSNHHTHTPYLIQANGRVVIDATWWDGLSIYVQGLLMQRLPDGFDVGHVAVPHEAQEDDPDGSKPLLQIYRSYIDGFDYNVWYRPDIPDGPRDVRMVELPAVLKPHMSKDEPAYALFRQELQAALGTDKHKWFVRLSATSGKNEKPVRPFTDVDDILLHITSNTILVQRDLERTDKPTHVILIPWNEKLLSRYEFRIFVVGGRLVAASPQCWWESYDYTSDELDMIGEALMRITFLQEQQGTFVADVYIDPESQRCKLIELNPFGAHCGAGSSLFNWIVDYDQLHGMRDCVELRFIHAIKFG